MRFFLLIFITSIWISACHSKSRHHKKHPRHQKSIITENENSNMKNYLFDIANPLISNNYLKKDARNKMHHANRKNEMQAENLSRQEISTQAPAPLPGTETPAPAQKILALNNTMTTPQQSTLPPVIVYETTQEDEESGSGLEEEEVTTTLAPVTQTTTQAASVTTVAEAANPSQSDQDVAKVATQPTTTPLAIPAGPSLSDPQILPAQDVVSQPVAPQDGMVTTDISPVVVPDNDQQADSDVVTTQAVSTDNAVPSDTPVAVKSHLSHSHHKKKKSHASKKHHEENSSGKHRVGRYRKTDNRFKKGKVTTHTLNRVSQTPNAAISQHAKSDTSAVVRLTSGNKQN